MGFTSSHRLSSDDHSGVYIVCILYIHIHIHVHTYFVRTDIAGLVLSSVCYSPPLDQPASQQPAFLFLHDDLQTSIANMNSSYSYTVILSYHAQSRPEIVQFAIPLVGPCSSDSDTVIAVQACNG